MPYLRRFTTFNDLDEGLPTSHVGLSCFEELEAPVFGFRFLALVCFCFRFFTLSRSTSAEQFGRTSAPSSSPCGSTNRRERFARDEEDAADEGVGEVKADNGDDLWLGMIAGLEVRLSHASLVWTVRCDVCVCGADGGCSSPDLDWVWSKLGRW